MRKVLVATHGYLADGVKSSVQVLLGMEDNITCINAYVDESDYTREVKSFLDAIGPEDEAVIFTDIYGGSVNQKIIQILPEKGNIFLVSGFNLPAVLAVMLQDGLLSEEIIESLLLESRENLKIYAAEKQKASMVETTEEDFF